MLTRTGHFVLVAIWFLFAGGAVHAQLTGNITSLVPAQNATSTSPVTLESIGDVNNNTGVQVTVKHKLAVSRFNPVTELWEEVHLVEGTSTINAWGSITGWTVNGSVTASPGLYLVTGALIQPLTKNMNILAIETHYFTVN